MKEIDRKGGRQRQIKVYLKEYVAGTDETGAGAGSPPAGCRGLQGLGQRPPSCLDHK